MQIEKGKCYKSRSGAKIGPMIADGCWFKATCCGDVRWNPAGVPTNFGDGPTAAYTLVAEWIEEIEWGDWEDPFPGDRRRCGDYQVQCIDGVKQIRFPKPKREKRFGKAEVGQFSTRFSVTFVDGVPDWSTLEAFTSEAS